MTLLEIRIALLILGTLILNGLTIVLVVGAAGWASLPIPLMGILTAMQLRDALLRRDRSSPTVLSRWRRNT